MNRSIILAPIFFLGCAGADVDSESDTDRGSIGKADLIGSCAETDCDGPAPTGNCWCDEECVENNDCCADRVEVCEAPVSPTCGGFANFGCSEGFYCHYGPETRCGSADQTGVCREIPQACTREFAPVCGCDGQTYGNSCNAAAAGVSPAFNGECPESPDQEGESEDAA